MPVDVLVHPSDSLTRHLDDSGWPLLAPTLLTIHRTSELDEMSRQIVYALDGQRLGELLFGHSRTHEIVPGPHRLRVHNTLVWQTLEFEAEPGEHVHFTVWNRAWGGYYVMMLFLGSSPLRLGVARGEPAEAAIAFERERQERRLRAAEQRRGSLASWTAFARVRREQSPARAGSTSRDDR
jgi:hypothetical protein